MLTRRISTGRSYAAAIPDILRKRGLFESGMEDVEFVTKPVTPFELLRKVRELLDRKN